MKIYFAFSIRGERRDDSLIKEVYEFLTQRGHKITTEFNIVGRFSEKMLTDEDIFNRDIEALENSDALLADVSKPSLGVGYEIAHAVCKNIKVYAFVKEETLLSAMINGNKKITLIKYKDIDELKNKLKEYF